MANVTVLSSCVQGVPAFLTLNGSSIVSHATSITNRQAGNGYYYQGDVVPEANIGDAGVITMLKALGAIV